MSKVQNGSGNASRKPDDHSQDFGRETKKWLKKLSKYVSEHGPRLAERTWLGGLLAYRRGSKALATNALSASGVDLKSAGISLALTSLLFIGFNICLSFGVSSSYHRYVPEFAKGKESPSALLQSFERNGWATSKENSSDLNKIATVENLQLPLHRWISIGFLELSSDKDNSIPSKTLQRYATGDATGWFMVRRDLPTGGGVYAKLLRDSETNRTLDNGIDGTPERRALCISMLDALASSAQLPIRLQMGLNGWIQFATIFVGLFALSAVVRRYFFVAKLAADWLGASFEGALQRGNDTEQDRELRILVERLGKSQDADPEALIRTEIDRLSRDTTKEIYESYWFIAGIMPSLGFLGTVVGMSSALMLANGLFVAQDKQTAIGDMTTQLGLAFDTTFVALAFGLIVGLPIAFVHARERTFFREFADCVTSWAIGSTKREASGATG